MSLGDKFCEEILYKIGSFDIPQKPVVGLWFESYTSRDYEVGRESTLVVWACDKMSFMCSERISKLMEQIKKTKTKVVVVRRITLQDNPAFLDLEGLYVKEATLTILWEDK